MLTGAAALAVIPGLAVLTAVPLWQGASQGDRGLATRRPRGSTRTKTKSPQTNGICERFQKTVLNEFYRVAFRKMAYRSLEELQTDLDLRIREYNEVRPHQGRWCFGKTPMQTFLDALPMTKEKMIAA